VSTYNPRGKPHQMLERLAESDCNFNRLAEVMPGGTMSSRKRKAYHTLENMITDGLVSGGRSRYFITQAGRDMLQALQAGSSAEVHSGAPSVRRFA
jgi:hypothetical protein